MEGAAGNSASSWKEPSGGCHVGSFHDNYLLSRKIGQGRFASLHVARYIPLGGYEVSVKIVDMRKDSAQGWDQDALDGGRWFNALTEIEMLQLMPSSKHVMKIYGFSMEGALAYISMETCQSTLLQTLERMPELNEASLKSIFRGMLKGIQAVHDVGLVHRDIKPDSFVCAGIEETVKLCDFGSAGVLYESDDGGPGLTDVFGSPPFMAPEMLRGDGYDEKVDLWSFGVIVYVLFFGIFPYMPEQFDVEAVMDAIRKGYPAPTFSAQRLVSQQPQHASQEATSFVSGLLSRELATRPTAERALGSGFMRFVMHPGQCLRCLRPMLRNAKHFGAFGDPSKGACHTTTDVDIRVSFLEQKRHGREQERRTLLAEAMAAISASMPPPAARGNNNGDDSDTSTDAGSDRGSFDD